MKDIAATMLPWMCVCYGVFSHMQEDPDILTLEMDSGSDLAGDVVDGGGDRAVAAGIRDGDNSFGSEENF